jgi:hypothetical protein
LASIRETFNDVEQNMSRARINTQKDRLMTAMGMPPNTAARELGNLRDMLDKKLNMSKFKEAIAGIAGGRDDQKKEAQTMMKANKSDPNLRAEIRKHGQQHLDGFDRAVNQSPVEFNRWFDGFAKAIGKPETAAAPTTAGAQMTYDAGRGMLTGAGVEGIMGSGVREKKVKDVAKQILTKKTDNGVLLASVSGNEESMRRLADEMEQIDDDTSAIIKAYEDLKARKETTDEQKKKIDEMIIFIKEESK